VIEHVYAPRLLLATLFRVLKPGGKLILSTPYHGYVKNLAVIASGRFDRHFNPLWDNGHIKFFSMRTLDQILHEAGFREIKIRGIGRAPYLWKTMLVTAQKPLQKSSMPELAVPKCSLR
jgi:2-polyprenyl-6-hydroxyphenyl methylase/3-demethylubiquinone-9 3-methyltransferase